MLSCWYGYIMVLVRVPALSGVCTITLASLLAWAGQPAPLLAQTGVLPLSQTLAQSPDSSSTLPDGGNQTPEGDEITDFRPLSQDTSLLSLEGGQRLLESAALAMDRQDYTTAQKDLQNARLAFNQISNFHQQLFDLFLGIDPRVADRQRLSAVESAQLRDEAAYRLALAHLAQNQPDVTVPLLIQVIRSQNPTSSLGQQAHQNLFNLGFMDSPPPALAQGNAADLVTPSPGPTEGTAGETAAADDRPLARSDSALSVAAGRRMMQEAEMALADRNYSLTVEKFKDARQVFNQLSNFYEGLSAAFRGIYTDIAETERMRAVETAQLRDEVTYQLALVHRVQNQSELAVPLLIQVLQSQNPSSELGQQAYQQLLELGFVDTPYRWQGVTGVR